MVRVRDPDVASVIATARRIVVRRRSAAAMTVAAVLAVAALSTAVADTAPPERARTTAVGSPVLSDSLAASKVRRSSWEPRPQNAAANRRIPSKAELTAFRGASQEQTPYAGYVTGDFTGTTDELLQWSAFKWGLDEDIVRATAVQESNWGQSAVGDGGISYGLMQIKSTVWRGTWPLSQWSTPFNVDMYGAIVRQCYEGEATWLDNGYTAGDLWGCLGYYFSGDWYDAPAERYIVSVRRHLSEAAWTEPDFEAPAPGVTDPPPVADSGGVQIPPAAPIPAPSRRVDDRSPAPGPRLGVTRTVRLVRGSLRVRVSCPASTARVTGTLTLRTVARSKSRRRTIGRASLACRGRDTTVVVRLSRAQRRLFGRRIVRMSARIVAREEAGAVAVTHKRLIYRPRSR